MNYLNTLAEIERQCNFIASSEDGVANYQEKLIELSATKGDIQMKLVDTGDFLIWSNQQGTVYLVNDSTIRTLYELREIVKDKSAAQEDTTSEGKLLTAQQAVEQQNETIYKLNSQIDDLEATISDLRRENKTLDNQLDNMNRTNDDLEDQCSRKDREIHNLETALRDKDYKISDLEDDVRRLQNEARNQERG